MSSRASSPALGRLCLASAALGLLALVVSAAEVHRAAGSNFAPDGPLARILGDAVWTTPLGLDLALFGVAQVVLHLAFGLTCGALAALSIYAWPGARLAAWKWLLLWWLLLGFCALLANAIWYRHSLLGQAYERVAHWQLAGISAWVAATLVTACALLATASAALVRVSRTLSPSPPVLQVALGITLLCSTAGAAAVWPDDPRSDATPGKAHVILIGIDSLRTDGTYPRGDGTLTPHLDRFLSRSVVFADAITPLARTYPAWVSLLTGRHPHSTGALVNLAPRNTVDAAGSLPEMLRAKAYRTVYAIDEVRFSNIDASYGFDQTISPPIGAADFVLSIVNDLPLSNLVLNTRLGARLFPCCHANRSAAVTYDPDSFLVRLENELRFEEPTFLALHLTLGHWPYRWRDAPSPPADESALYRAAIRRVDAQFASVMGMLASKGALQNALVVVFSDHGEALGELDDAAHASAPAAAADSRAPTGHGTSVLSPQQYQIVLAWRAFGTTPFGALRAQTVDAPASLEDVAPTLAEGLGLASQRGFDGLSLLPLLRSGSARRSFGERVRFTETEFNPPGFAPGQVPTEAQVREAVSRYVVDRATGRLQLRPESIGRLMLANRQYAAMSDTRLLAALPEKGGFRYTLVDRASAVPARSVRPEDIASDPELSGLWAALQDRFEPLRSGPASVAANE
jgi:hypothetical protein